MHESRIIGSANRRIGLVRPTRITSLTVFCSNSMGPKICDVGFLFRIAFAFRAKIAGAYVSAKEAVFR